MSQAESHPAVQQQPAGRVAQDAVGKPCPAEEYANRVLAYSRQPNNKSLYPGHHYWYLAGYLRSAFESRSHHVLPNPAINPTRSQQPFAKLYCMKTGQARPLDLGLTDEQSLNAVDTNDLHKGEALHLLFLQGHPSPMWLNTIGAKYHVDPEFFLRHLRFRASVSRPNHFSLPYLPSAVEGLFCLRLTSLGYRHKVIEARNQNAIDKLRKHGFEEMDKYAQVLKGERDWRTGDSIVREFSVHDEEHCSLEQDISISMRNFGQGWVVIMWSDYGRDLLEGPPGPWSSGPFKDVQWLPTVQYKPNVALIKAQLPSQCHPEASSTRAIFQSATLLPFAYARKTDGADVGTTIKNPFLALIEVLRFAASSELQILNLLQSKLNTDLDPRRLIDQKTATLSNLLHTQRILSRHIAHINENIASITSRGGVDPIGLSQHQKDKTDAAANLILKDFQHLSNQANEMLSQCERGMSIIMNNTMLQESQRAIEQAEGVTKLTKLAFFFIPSSFTASFFGMNVLQFGTGSLQLWTYFVVSVPIVAISLLLMNIDIDETWKNGRATWQLYRKTGRFRTTKTRLVSNLNEDVDLQNLRPNGHIG